MDPNKELEKRVLVFMPTGRDGSLVCTMLARADIEASICNNAFDLGRAIEGGAGAVLIAEEALTDAGITNLIKSLENQPIWSDLPVILFSSNSKNADFLLQTLESRINITVVERPIRATMLLSEVRGALRSRERQYQTRDLLARLEQADRQKDLFLATLSHELRTPLNSIIGWIRLLRGKRMSENEVDHALDVIERNAKAQAEIISDILFVSRVVTGKLELKLAPVQLAEVVREALDIVRPAVEAKGLTADLDIHAPNVCVNADADRLQQIFLNLLSNAVKFTDSGGRISILVEESDGRAEVRVIDTGRGISSDFLPLIFERFRQADNEYSRSVGGLGLGLAIVRHLAELHGGTAEASSNGLGSGSTFTVALPLYVGAEPDVSDYQTLRDQNAPESPGKNVLSDASVLLVEDDQDSSDMLRAFLVSIGMSVTAVDSAAAALDRVGRMRPDLILSDVGLPGQDGHDFIRAVRSLAANEGGQTPAIALTGYVSNQDRKLALAAGFQEHLPKPIDFDQLVERMIAVLQPCGSENGNGRDSQNESETFSALQK